MTQGRKPRCAVCCRAAHTIALAAGWHLAIGLAVSNTALAGNAAVPNPKAQVSASRSAPQVQLSRPDRLARPRREAEPALRAPGERLVTPRRVGALDLVFGLDSVPTPNQTTAIDVSGQSRPVAVEYRLRIAAPPSNPRPLPPGSAAAASALSHTAVPDGKLPQYPETSPLGVQRIPPVTGSHLPALQQVAHRADGDPREWTRGAFRPAVLPLDEPRGSVLPGELPPVSPEEIEAALANMQMPIDLANALALAGASSLQIRLARERVIEAQANYLGAKANWLPSLRFGLGYNRHNGRIQATNGQVIEASRNSLFVGGGAGLGDVPLNGGAGGPPRLFVSLSLADAYFAPKVANRLVGAAGAAARATLNDEMLAAAEAYYDLAEIHGLLANALAARKAAGQMHQLTSLFAQEGNGSLAEVDRAQTELTFWDQAVNEASRQTNVASAKLARLLRLDPNLILVPVETKITPVEVIPSDIPRHELVAQGMAGRPELAQYRWLVGAAHGRLKQERWRPWLPNLHVGASGGTFGGGQSGAFTNQSGRDDLDLLAVWEWRNMGLGNAALQRNRGSQVRQANYQVKLIGDQIAEQIVAASGDVSNYREQIDITLAGVGASQNSYRRNLHRIEQAEGIPLELLQAIRARNAAQDAYTKATSDYNRAQYRLLRAIGQPPVEP